MESLTFYLKTAERAIGRWGHPSMMNDDFISEVAGCIMRADGRFDGRGNIAGFRMATAKFRIIKEFSEYRKRLSRTKTISLDYVHSRKNKGENLLDDIEDSKAKTPFQQMMMDNVEGLVNSCDELKDREKSSIICVYLQGMSYRETAEQLGVSHEQIRLDVNAGIGKLRAKYNVED